MTINILPTPVQLQKLHLRMDYNLQGQIPYLFNYKTEFFPSTILKSTPILSDGSSSLGLLRNGKTCTIAKFHRTDLLFLVILERGKPCLIAK